MLTFTVKITCANCGRYKIEIAIQGHFGDGTAVTDGTEKMANAAYGWRKAGWQCLGGPDFDHLCPNCATTSNGIEQREGDVC